MDKKHEDGFSVNSDLYNTENNANVSEDAPMPDDTGFIGLNNYSDKATAERKAQRKKHNLWKRFVNWWKPLSKPKKGLCITCVSLFLVLCIMVGVLWPYLNYNYNEITSNPNDLGFEKQINKEIVNIALFGIDTRNKDSFKGLSDSMMIMSLNTKTKKVKVISLMRDTLVPIEKGGKTTYGKLNSAYGSGGPELGIKTINQIFDLDISEYATINFFGMVDIIDAVGGIDITVTEDELKWKGEDHPNLNNCMDEICFNLGKDSEKYHIDKPGQMHANGIQAVAYSRVRNCRNVWGTNNDYGRTDRQRYVMQQLFQKATKLGKKDYMKLAKALIPCSETSLSYSQILSLAFDVLLEHPTFEQYRIPQENFNMSYPSGYGSVVYFDLDYATRAIHSIIYDDMTLDQFIEQHPVEKNDWYAKRTGGTQKTGGGTASTVTEPATGGNEVVNRDNPTVTPSESTPTTSTDSSGETKPQEKDESEETKSETTPTEEETQE